MSMRFDPVTGERIQEDSQAAQKDTSPGAGAGGDDRGTAYSGASQGTFPAGGALETGDSGQPHQSYFYQQPAPEEQPKKKKTGLILAVIAALLVLAAGAVVWVVKSGVFTSNSAKVLEAAANTFRDTDDLAGAFQFGNILLSDESTVMVSSEAEDFSMELQFLYGKDRKQMLGSIDMPNFMEVYFQAELTEEELMVQVPSAADYIFTYNYQEPKNGYLQDYYGDSLDDIDELLEALYSPEDQAELDTDLAKAIAEECGKLEFEKVSSEEFEVDQEKRTCTGIATTVTRESLENIFDELEDTVRDSMESAYGYGDIYTEYYFDQLEDSISEIEDVDLTFFIYEKKLACVRVEIEDEEAEIRFLGGDTRMQNMQFLIDGEEMLRIEGEKKDTTEVRTVFLEGEESVTLEYNRKTGLLDITADGGRTVIAGNIFLDKDSFNASIDRVMVDGQFVDLTFGMNIKKGAAFQEFDGEKFDLGQASVEDIQALFIELNQL